MQIFTPVRVPILSQRRSKGAGSTSMGVSIPVGKLASR
jgi:hypothetical protein